MGSGRKLFVCGIVKAKNTVKVRLKHILSLFFFIMFFLSTFSLLAETKLTNSSSTNSSATNTSSSTTNTFIIPRTEEGKRASMLKQFIDSVDEATLRAIAKKFNLTTKGSLKDLRKDMEKYLGLLNTIQDTRKKSAILIRDLFKTPDLKKNFVVYADEGVHIRSRKDSASGIITLRGDQGNLYVKFQKQIISARLIRIDIKRRQIFGEGNAMIKEGDRIIIGDKFYFDSKDKTGVIYNAQTFIKPYFYYGEKIKKIGEKSYVLDNGWLTTSNAARPHFKFGVGKAWLYQDLRLVAVDVTYQVSDFPVFWFPFLFHPMKGTGFHVGLGRDTRVGWFMQVDNIGSFFELPFELKFDFYQNLGVAILGGKKGLKWKDFSVDIATGIAMDKPLQWTSSGWANNVDGYGDGHKATDGPYGDWKRELRWKVDLTPRLTIYHDDKNKKLGSTTISGKFQLSSDPSFTSDFEGTRITKIDIEKLYRQEEVNFFSGGGASSRNWSIDVSDRRGGSTLALKASWAFAVEEHSENNLYANNRWQYRRSEIVFPSLSYSYGGTIFSSQKKTTTVTTGSTNTNVKSVVKPDGKVDILDLGNASQTDKSSNGVNYSLSYSASVSLEQRMRYDSEDTLIEQYYNRNFSLSIPASFSIGTVFTTTLNVGFADRNMWGNSTNESHQQGYESSSVTTLNESFGMRLGHIFNKGKLSEVGGEISVNHSLAMKMAGGSSVDDYNKISANRVSTSVRVNLFKTTINASTAFDMTIKKLEDRDWGKDRFDPLSISASTQPFEFLTITESYSYVIRTGLSTANNLNFTFKSPAFRLPGIDKVSSFNLGVSWYHDYNNPTGSSLNINLSFETKINDLWLIKFAMNSRNKELYLYSEEKARSLGKEPRNIFRDFLYSLMFWDTDKLKETRFNIQSLSINLIHDLHDWQMTFSTTVSQQKNTEGRDFTFFDFQFAFSISMKQNIGIKFPEQRFRYKADTDGVYRGKYN